MEAEGGADVTGQRFHEPLDPELGGAVDFVEGLADKAAHGRDGHHPACARRAHGGQDGLCAAHDAAQVHIKHPVDVRLAGLFQRADIARARIVDQGVDPAGFVE